MASATLHYAAFTTTPDGGNPAGVVLDAEGMSDAEMQAEAARVGYSESAFLTRRAEPGHYDVRYWSPEAEVPFCGHATIASGVALAEHHGADGRLVLHTASGPVAVDTTTDDQGHSAATLTSVQPHVEPAGPVLVAETLACLGWEPSDLDPRLPARVAYAGARHLIMPCASRERLAEVDYDFAALKGLMLGDDLITVDLVWREEPTVFHSRNLFPVGGVVEDPATGAAAAAFGAYLRELGEVDPPAELTIHQGHDMGRPSTLAVYVDTAERPELRVSGTAVAMPA